MPQLFPTQWVMLVNMSFLTIFLVFSTFNFSLFYPVNTKTKIMNHKYWKW